MADGRSEATMKAVILAGGAGTRLWPVSRASRPKQFHPLVGERSLIQQTFDRLRGLFPAQDIYVCTVADYAAPTRDQLPELPPENIIVEPASRNTGPALGLIATRLHARFGDTVVATVHADHRIERPEAFVAAIERAIRAVQAHPRAVATIGIRPTRAETGYGYIRIGESQDGGDLFAVEQFVEKPDAGRAEQFLADGRYLWNAGYFIWSTGRMLALVEEHMPQVAAGLARIRAAFGTPAEADVVRAAYAGMPSVAIDTGVMERADPVVVVPAEMGWSDVGSWERLHEVMPAGEDGVVALGPHVGVENHDCLFVSDGRLIAAIGLSDLIVVVTEDVVLVCPRGRAQDLKALMDRLRKEGLERYLD
jgi:mannose-1-phosphate guanylyltransferase